MDSALPVIMSRHAMTGDNGPIPTCITADKFHYVAHAILVRQVARKAQKHPDSIWLMYLQTQDGNSFREQMHKDFSAAGHLNVKQLVQFTSPDGMEWTHRRLAVHFVSKYDPALEHTIFKHFEETAMGGAAPKTPSRAVSTQAIVPAQPLGLTETMSLEMVLRQSQQMTVVLQEMIRVRDKVDVIDIELGETKHLVAQNTQAIADLRARAGPAPGQMIMREFVLTRLHRRESEEQLKQWGAQLSAQLRRIRSGAVPQKVWDPLAKIPINEYAVGDLEQFFRSLGLL